MGARILLRMVMGGFFTSAAACATFPLAPDEDPGKVWLRVNTANFSLATDMDREPAERLAETLENWWTAMDVVVARLAGARAIPVPDHERLLVIALRNRWEQQEALSQLGGVRCWRCWIRSRCFR